MSVPHQARIHAQTLAELNHCVGTARRDAAYSRLLEIGIRTEWPKCRSERAAIYGRCLFLVEEAINATARSSLFHSNPRLGICDKPVLHFLRMVKQLLQTMNLLAEHVEHVQREADVLAEHLGEKTYQLLESTCNDFEHHEIHSRSALTGTLLVGQNLVESNTEKRREGFSQDDARRYAKAYGEYRQHYSQMDD